MRRIEGRPWQRASTWASSLPDRRWGFNNHMSIKTHYIIIIPIITENKNDLSSIKVKYFLRQDKNFTNIDFEI
jgi:hypothetical protein